MSKFWSVVVFCFVSLVTSAQYTVSGKVVDNNGLPLSSATISLLQKDRTVASTISDARGTFELRNVTKGNYEFSVEHVSLTSYITSIRVAGNISLPEIRLYPSTYALEPLEVTAIRASDKAPFSKTILTKAEIAKGNLGQDLPFVLNQTPGVVVNSDAGNGIGYTGIRIRGSDATRINVTVNGIPYNDAENQGTFFVDLPDFASSLKSIQVQRGVGSSSNGAAAFGATISLSTNELNELPYAEANNSYGSFNSWKNTIRVGSGLLSNHFTIDMRASRISSDGFIDRASSNLKSFYLSGAYISKNNTLRFNYFTGTEKTYQAWNGIPEGKITNNDTALLQHYYNNIGYLYYTPADSANLFGSDPRKYNYFTYANQTDNYKQDHFQLFFNHTFNSKLALNTGLFLVPGKGYYEEYKPQQDYASYNLPYPVYGTDTLTTTDLIRQLWLDNKFYGQIFSLLYTNKAHKVTFGGAWTRYEGNHFGKIIWADAGIPNGYEWYRLTALKTDYNLYTKWEYSASKNLDLYADVQYRRVSHDMNGFRDNPTLVINRDFNFFNPKAGVTYHLKGVDLSASYALGHREPNRDDFEAGTVNQPKYETLHDIELNAEHKSQNLSWSATGYYMLYKDQLILTGKINDVGAYTRTNVPNSYRAGVELQGRYNITSYLSAAANLALSKNKIKASAEYIDDYDNGGQQKVEHTNTDIALSPSIVGGATITLMPVQRLDISLISKYVSRQYLDNTHALARSLAPYFVQDARASYVMLHNKWVKELSITAVAYNIFSKRYQPNGYTYSYLYGGSRTTENFYFPMAGVNYMVGINLKM